MTKHEYFVYDGYKLIEKLNVLDSNAITQKFVWSGETILSMNDANGTYYYLIDANKNVGQLLDSSGTIKAKYEYSPFGKLTSSTDNVSNPFRFSSEYFDEETRLVYYNYRYYDAGLGRWTKRDMIEERGGVNLYGFVFNDGVNWVDAKGLECCGKRELKSGEACCAGKYPYNTSKKCCYNKLLYIRRYTSDQCEANRIKCIRHVIDTLGAFAGSQSIGPAALGTVVTGVGGYVLGGMASSAWGGPVGFAVGAGAGAVVGIITIGADMAAIDAARKECKDSYDRCIECQKN